MNESNTKQDWIDEMFDHAKEARLVANDLHTLAVAFHQTGNATMCDTLMALSERSSSLGKGIRAAVADKTQADLAEAHRMTAITRWTEDLLEMRSRSF